MSDSTGGGSADRDFIEEMRHEENRNIALRAHYRLVRATVENSIKIVSAGSTADLEVVMGTEVTSVVSLLITLTRNTQTGRSDILKGVALALMAAWRFAHGGVRGMDCILDPKGQGSVDDPIEI